MVAIAVRHKVADFDKWLAAYNEHSAARVKHGQISDVVYPNLEAGGDVLIVTEWDSAESFERFAAEVNISEVMKNAGVISAPDITVFGKPVA